MRCAPRLFPHLISLACLPIFFFPILTASLFLHSLFLRGGSDPGQPTLKAAHEYMRYFLPKRADGKLLPLTCSEAEFAQHVGSGVAMYMHFVKMTGWLFVLATVIAMPQFIANIGGGHLKLSWPLGHEGPCNPTGFFSFVSEAIATFQWVIYASELGNVEFNTGTYGIPHLCSELLLSMLFCVYVFLTLHINTQVLEEIEAEGVRASDFAVMVSRLPATGSDPDSLRAHFAFFGDVASVAVSTENHRLLSLLEKQRSLQVRWRHLHLAYGRALKSSRAVTHSAGGAQLRAESGSHKKGLNKLLDQIEVTWGELLRTRAELRSASTEPALCTGHAVVIFKEMSAAAKCARHFELIRRHERSVATGSLEALDFRQLYFRTSHKLDVTRAPEPSDILWGNLRASRLVQDFQGFKSTFILLLLIAVSTICIFFTNYLSTSQGLLEHIGPLNTVLIIVFNVIIFATVPNLALKMELHHYRSSQHTLMLYKMWFFQLLNTTIAGLLFMGLYWAPLTPSCPISHPETYHDPPGCFMPEVTIGANPLLNVLRVAFQGNFFYGANCVSHWYTTGAYVILSAVLGDLTAILLLIEFLKVDKMVVRYVVAPRAPTQAEMNQIYTLDSELYLPFRYQLVLKMVCIAFWFSSAIPLLLPIGALFMGLSWWIDRYNFLRVFKPPPRTTEREITNSLLIILPIAAFGHMFFAMFFYSLAAEQPVPFIYYGGMLVLLALLMRTISRWMRQQNQRPIKEQERYRYDDDDDDDDRPNGSSSKPSESLHAHLDSIELYVPPLSGALLKAAYTSVARERELVEPTTSSTRSGMPPVEEGRT